MCDVRDHEDDGGDDGAECCSADECFIYQLACAETLSNGPYNRGIWLPQPLKIGPCFIVI